MTTSTLKTESIDTGFGIQTFYTFDVLSTEKQNPIGDYCIVVDEFGNDMATVNYIFDGYVSKDKNFTDIIEAHFYAMKLVKKFKAQYK